MKQGIFLLLCIACFQACSPVRVVSTEILTDDFSKYNTYGYYEPAATTGIYHEDLIAAIDAQLKAKGMSQSQSPDLMINIGTSVTDVATTRETDYRDIRYSGQRNYSWESEEVIVSEYKEGTVVLDFVDTESGKMVWQGSAASAIDGKLNQKNDKMISRINDAMQKLFAKFPK